MVSFLWNIGMEILTSFWLWSGIALFVVLIIVTALIGKAQGKKQEE